ncbi:zinc finger and BTB domain-containing protein 16-like [Tachysurus ichikawai]
MGLMISSVKDSDTPFFVVFAEKVTQTDLHWFRLILAQVKWSIRKLHSGMKTYGCELCGKRFLDSLRLRMHLLSHSVIPDHPPPPSPFSDSPLSWGMLSLCLFYCRLGRAPAWAVCHCRGYSSGYGVSSENFCASVLYEGRTMVGNISHNKQEILGGEQATLSI